MPVPDSGLSKEWIRKNYRAYLKTKHWKNLRLRYKRSKLPWKCYVCGSTERLQLHHRSYRRVGRERLQDLIPMCRACHSEIHRLERRHGVRGMGRWLWSAARRLKRHKQKKGKREAWITSNDYGLVTKCGRRLTNAGMPYTKQGIKDHERVCRHCKKARTPPSEPKKQVTKAKFNPLTNPKGWEPPARTDQQQDIHEQFQQVLRKESE